MSWIETLKDSNFKIITGDGKVYTPSLVPKFTDTTEYNNTKYDYINREGSLVVRRFPQGTQFPLEFCFQGENHMNTADLFKFSAKDNRAWQVTHPIYGQITCQPLGITRDFSALSATFITCTVIETNLKVQQAPDVAPKTKITDLKSELDTTVQQKYSGIQMNDANKTNLKGQMSKASVNAQRIAKAQETITGIKESLQKGLNEVNNAIATTTSQIRYVQRIIELPAIEATNLMTRLDNMFNALSNLSATVKGVTNLTQFDKISYEMTATAYLGASVLATTITGENEFSTRKNIANYISRIQIAFADYNDTLYSMEDSNYSPAAEVQTKLNELINVALFNFYELIFNAKQEREYICKTDTNIIVLAHKLYGLASEDNINYLKQTNKIGLSEIFKVPQGKKIVYYI